MKGYKLIAALLFFLKFTFLAEAQSTFLKTYGSSESEYGTSLCLSNDGGFVVASILPTNSSGDIKAVLFKTDRNGEQVWVKSYGNNFKNVPNKVVNSSDGGYYVLMSSWSNFSPGDFRSVLLKVDSLGNEIWNRSLSFSQSDNAVDIDVEGNYLYVLCISTYNTGGYPGVLVHKLDKAGSRIWSHNYTAPYQFSPVDAALDDSGRLAILGKTNSYGIGTPINDNNFLLLIDSAGNDLNTTITGIFYSYEPNSIIWQNGKWVISTLGYTLAGGYDIGIQSFDSMGIFIESKRYDATSSMNAWEVARDIIPQEDGSIILAGDIGTFDERNIMLAKIDPSGNVAWSYEYPVSPIFTNYAFELVQCPDGGFAFTGDMRPPSYFRDAYILKSDSFGQIPCYTTPIHFTVNPDTVEVSYVAITNTEVIPNVDTLMIDIATPFYPAKIECENIPPIALFNATLDTICPKTCYTFTDASLNTIDNWEWTFNGGQPATYSGQTPPTICYENPGTFPVNLQVSNADGTSAYSLDVNIYKIKCDTLFIPNVVTPNNDGKNDLFSIRGLPEKFNLKIYNRWGKLIYETEAENSPWNAKNVSPGVYYYLLRLYSSEGNENHRGTVSVLKN